MYPYDPTATPAAAPPMPGQPRSPAVHDGLAIASLVLSLLWLGGLGSLLAVIFGWTSSNAAHRAHRRSSALGDWGLGLGVLGLIGAVIIWAAIIYAAAHAGTSPACDYTSPAYPYC
jgi:hypothetical protein